MNLFGKEQVVETKLEISPKTKAPLSKAQQDFNKITKRVEKLEKDLVNKEKSWTLYYTISKKTLDLL